MSNSKQYFGIKFPFTSKDFDNYYVDLNQDKIQKVRSQLMHVIFTQKGTKLRDPLYGTNLLKYIFDQNFEDSWGKIKNEITSAVQTYVRDARLDDISLQVSEDDLHEVYVRMDISVKDGNEIKHDSIITTI